MKFGSFSYPIKVNSVAYNCRLRNTYSFFKSRPQVVGIILKRGVKSIYLRLVTSSSKCLSSVWRTLKT